MPRNPSQRLNRMSSRQSFAVEQFPHCGLLDLVFSRNGSLAQAGKPEPHYFIKVAIKNLLLTVPSLPRAVLRIVAECPQKQMLGVHAATHVAAVQNAKAIWNRSFMDLPRKAMGRLSLVFNTQGSIASVAKNRSDPQPAARIGLRNVLLMEPNLERHGLRHDDLDNEVIIVPQAILAHNGDQP